MSNGVEQEDRTESGRGGLDGVRVAFLMANEGVERAELVEPWEAVGSAGGTRLLVATEPGSVQLMDHVDKGPQWEADLTTRELRLEDVDAVVLPGGAVNSDELRTDDAAVAFLREAFDSGRPVAAICHAPWSLVEAGVLENRTLTSWPSLRTDIENAGGNWVDEPVQLCADGPNVLVTSRKPDDLEAFCSTLLRVFRAEARAEASPHGTGG
jgi:protease I